MDVVAKKADTVEKCIDSIGKCIALLLDPARQKLCHVSFLVIVEKCISIIANAIERLFIIWYDDNVATVSAKIIKNKNFRTKVVNRLYRSNPRTGYSSR